MYNGKGYYLVLCGLKHSWRMFLINYSKVSIYIIDTFYYKTTTI